jgi:cell wall-associated protease
MKKSVLLKLALLLVIFSCNKPLKSSPIPIINDTISTKELSDDLKKEWYFKDVQIDSLPGISLKRVYDSIYSELPAAKEVIVAVIDMPLEINHEDLKDNIWVNPNEIPDNNIDDDKNGYVDDVNGWNFLGNTDGKIAKFINYEYTRILKKYHDDFENNLLTDSVLIKSYLKANEYHKKRFEFAVSDTARIYDFVKNKKTYTNNISRFIDKDSFSIKNLDSVGNLYPEDSTLQTQIEWMKNLIKNKITDAYIASRQLQAHERINKLLNVDYNDRAVMGDNPDDIKDKNYGSPTITSLNGFFNHATIVSGYIAARRDNGIGAKGISDRIKIMSLCTSAFGDEHDKDIALAIRYAVDNGAKVINLSFGKQFSLYSEWVFDAVKYADKNDVLIVKSAGNNGKDLSNFEVYPNDNNYINQDEVADNFLMVGASSYQINEKLFAYFSNYGASQVDLFAPGVSMYTTVATDEKYKLNFGGTSTSTAVTSGVAALIFSHYPNLTATQVKQIIMDSGVKYDFNVKVGDTLLPFTSLSKSGRILNAYNALIMSDSISRL